MGGRRRGGRGETEGRRSRRRPDWSCWQREIGGEEMEEWEVKEVE